MPVPRQPGQSRFDSHDLRGASDTELAQFALDWARHELRPLNMPSVLLARAVSYEEMPQLGLGCPPNFSMVNPPPVMVAILRGEFDFRGVGPGFRYAQAPVAGKEQYAYYVFDVWNALPVITMSSDDGAPFRQAHTHQPKSSARSEIRAVCLRRTFCSGPTSFKVRYRLIIPPVKRPRTGQLLTTRNYPAT